MSASTTHPVDVAALTERGPIADLWARVAGRLVRGRGDIALGALDALFIAVGSAVALLLRYDFSVPDQAWSNFTAYIPISIGAVLAANFGWGLYGQLWRHASLYEARHLAQSGITAIVVLVAVDLFPRPVPISVAIMGPVLATFLMGLVRFQSRLFAFQRGAAEGGMRVVVVGAGDAGASLVADMLRSPRAGLRPVAVLDDDPIRHGRAFMGVSVAGGIDDLESVVKRTGAHMVVFAMTNADQATIRRAAAQAERSDVAMKIVPGISSAMRGNVSLRDVRDLRIEDLLGRDQVVTDLESVGSMLAGQRVLITGAGGSIGSEIARQVHAFLPASLVLLDHDETHLHEVAAVLDGDHVVQSLADVRSLTQMRRVFALHRPTVVFHAAAHKHVPLLESHPTEAVSTNVIGTANVLDAAREAGVERLVFVSTDKAVYPSSVMGASKRIGEQLVISRAPQGAAYCAVRFGNVLGSRGSVVPTFVRQIDAGGPVTVTDRRMTRFFMSITEAVQLVLQAAALAQPRRNGEGGSVFMLDMGEPVVIHDLAERMIRLSGRRPGEDIEIRITGIRPGEKLAEELHTLDEQESPTAHPSIRRVTPVTIDPTELESSLVDLELRAIELDDARCVELLLGLAGADADTTPTTDSDISTEINRESVFNGANLPQTFHEVN
jgi:FlaA1/EpsC-like NDP-sugar epimerase